MANSDLIISSRQPVLQGDARIFTSSWFRFFEALSQLVGGTLPPSTAADLPATAPLGEIGFVTDANTTLILGLGSTVVGGGSNKVPVYFDGSSWIIG